MLKYRSIIRHQDHVSFDLDSMEPFIPCCGFLDPALFVILPRFHSFPDAKSIRTVLHLSF
jgi:hypothetical protein